MTIADWLISIFTLILMINLVAMAFVVRSGKRSSVAVRLFWLILIFIIWSGANYLGSIQTIEYGWSLAINRVVFIVALAMLSQMISFCMSLSDYHPTRSLRYIFRAGTIGLGILAATNLVVKDVYHHGQTVGIAFGRLSPVYLLGLLLLSGSIIYILARAYVRAGYKRTYEPLLLGSFLAAIMLVVWSNIIAPMYFEYYDFTTAGPLMGWALFSVVAYISIKHKIIDVRFIAVRSVVYFLSITTMALAYFGLAYIASTLLFHSRVTDELSVSPINIALALILAFIFQPIKHFFDRWTNRFFYRDQYDPTVFVEQLGSVLTSTTRLREVLERSLDKVTHTLKSNGGLFVVYRENHEDMLVGRHELNHFTDKEYALLRRLVELQGSRVLQVDAESRHCNNDIMKLHRLLVKKRIALALPLVSVDETVGYLLLGEQMSSGYSKRDIATLEMICNELVIAIMNARSMQVVRDLNTHLEQRVEEATHELQRSNARLIELDTTKDEFLSMASHQLRTPLTSIKGYISMVLEGDAGALTDTQQKLLAEAFTSSERMVHLISDFLNVSRLQTGKFMIERTQTDLSEVIADEVEGMEQMATSHGVKITYRKPHTCPLLYVDEGKLRQVIMNFMDNAIYYSPESKKITVRLSIEDGDVVFRVIDTGMGVPLDVQKKLFTKFFRAENARKQRPDGTGIGLFLAKKIIDGHDGKLVFESTPGKGSTFGFRLPIKQLS